MPLFEFRCSGCGSEFETLVRSSEKVCCPECESEQLEKLLSVATSRTTGGSLPIAEQSCPPSDAPPCGPGCCRMM